jgi:hypothetical protein
MTKSVKKRFSGGELSENEFEKYVDAMHAMVVAYEYSNYHNNENWLKNWGKLGRMIKNMCDSYEYFDPEDGSTELTSKMIQDVVKREFELSQVGLFDDNVEVSEEDPIWDFGQKLTLKQKTHISKTPSRSTRSTRSTAGGKKKTRRSTRKKRS